MNLQEYTEQMRPAVEAELHKGIDLALPAQYPELREMLAYHMGWEGDGAGPEAQGKRIRPMLALLCAQAAGGDWHIALPAAAAVELLHNFSLIHDDIQDRSPLRRNRPAVWVRWGQAQAINAGDVMFTLAFLSIQDLAGAIPAQSVLRASRILQETCLQLTQGQYLDISYESKSSLPMDAYWPMISGKTSALLGCCCELGALCAGVGEDRQAIFREYGYSLGLAFQVLDDWLGIWGDPELTGKSAESDLVSGKKTLPVLFGLAKEGPFARRWLQGSIQPDEAHEVACMLKDEGASTYTLETAARLTDQAMNALRDAGCSGDAARALEDLTRGLLQRKS